MLSQREANGTDELTDAHPHGEPAPGGQVQLHHQIDVDKDTEQREPRQQWHLHTEGFSSWQTSQYFFFFVLLSESVKAFVPHSVPTSAKYVLVRIIKCYLQRRCLCN